MITISCINGHQQETKPNLTLHILHTTLFILEIDNNYDIRICKMHKWKFRIMWTAYVWKHGKTKTVGIYVWLPDEPTDDRVWKSNWGRVVADQSSTHSYIKIFTYQDIHLFCLLFGAKQPTHWLSFMHPAQIPMSPQALKIYCHI